ncbi:MAG TPA: ABC transporter ATP-binding protein [Bacteroidota bacterium]|nr:ABC transporter ATP-binding protein [Bacteroidota bacterium]
MIALSNISKRYGEVVALDSISLEIPRGELFGLLGPNGAGKTTLMSLLVGHRRPDAGSIAIDGRQTAPDDLEIRRAIGYVPQQIALYDELSAVENLHIFGRFYDLGGTLLRTRADDALKAVQLHERRKDKVKNFSGGMQRRLNLAAALLHEPPILLCDEPTVGVDPQSRNAIFDFLETLHAQGTTIVYTTHYMEEVERLCNRIAIIDHGRVIAEGSRNELLRLLPYEETLMIKNSGRSETAADELGRFGALSATGDTIELKPVKGAKMSEVIGACEQSGIPYSDIEWKKPTLEAVFLHLTGRSMRD